MVVVKSKVVSLLGSFETRSGVEAHTSKHSPLNDDPSLTKTEGINRVSTEYLPLEEPLECVRNRSTDPTRDYGTMLTPVYTERHKLSTDKFDKSDHPTLSGRTV